MSKSNLLNVVVIGGLYVIGGVIIKKLNDIHDEIEHFEFNNGGQYIESLRKRNKRIKQEIKEANKKESR